MGEVGLFVALGACAAARDCGAQTAGMGPGIAGELRQIASRASAIFVGQIVSITHKGGVVEVTFRVEQPVLGAQGGQFVLREWAGLWPPGHSRYIVGQRALAFVHGSGTAGLSSPVHGAEGLVPVVVQGTTAPRLLDVRRVAAAVVRTPGTPMPTEANGGMRLSDVLEFVNPGAEGGSREPALVALPLRGQAMMDLPLAGEERYPVVLPFKPPVRSPVKAGPVREGGVALR